MKAPQVIKWGILGCGKIADKFASDLALSASSTLHACASRNKEKSEIFAQKHSAKYAFTSYEELVRHPEIDVIYIATPHTFHMEHTLLCLVAKKHVLCEKPLGINALQVNTMTRTANDQQVFLMEAMWTACLPYFSYIKPKLENGWIGEIRHIQADFGFKTNFDPKSRLFDPELAGGSLLDIGIYPIFIALSLLGKPDTIHAAGTLSPTMVDAECTVLFRYNSGATATLYSTLSCNTDTKCEIFGTEGKITVPGRFHEQDHFFHTNDDGMEELLSFPKIGFGYTHEIEHVVNCIHRQSINSDIMTHAMSLLLIETMDEIRKQIGVVYPVDSTI